MRHAAGLNFLEVLPEPGEHFFVPAFGNLLLELGERKMHHIVVVQFGPELGTALEPDLVEKVNFLGRQAWRVRTEIEDLFLAGGRINLYKLFQNPP